jgi:hypothetical protein
MYYITYKFNGLTCEATLPTLLCVEALEASGAVLLSSRWME